MPIKHQPSNIMARIFSGILLTLLSLLYLPVNAQSDSSPLYVMASRSDALITRGQTPAIQALAPNEGLRLKKVIRGNIRPKSIVHSGNGRFFAQNMMYRHSITVYDRNYNLIQTISDRINLSQIDHKLGYAQGAPVEAAFTPDGQYAWVSNYSMSGKGFDNPGNDNCAISQEYDHSYVYKINTQTLKIENAVEVGCVPKFLTVSPDNRMLLVTNWCSGDLSLVDLQNETEVKRISIGRYPRGIAIDSKSRNAYISVMGEDKIAILKLSDGTLSWIDQIGDTPRHLLLGPDDRFLYVTLDREGLVKKYDLVRQRLAGKVSVGKSPRSMTLSGFGQFLYVANYSGNSLAKVNTRDMTVKQTVETNEKPIGITFDPTTHSIWVACYTGSIMVFEDEELILTDRQIANRPAIPEREEVTITDEKGLTYVPGVEPAPYDPNYYLYRDKELERLEREQKARTVPPRTLAPANVHFLIIVGSFSSQQAANRKVSELKRNGISAEVVPTGKGQFRVSSGSFPNKTAAESEMTLIKQRYNMDAWIWRKER